MKFEDLRPGDKFILVRAHRRCRLTVERPVLVKTDPDYELRSGKYIGSALNAVYLSNGALTEISPSTEVAKVTKLQCDDQYEGVQTFII